MTFISKLHPLVVHFPIALVLMAAVAELVVIVTARKGWRTVAVANIRAGALAAIVTAMTGWLFASGSWVDATTSLEWHRWLGLAEAAGAITAALLSRHLQARSGRQALGYRFTLFVTALLTAVTAHLGGILVWGPGFFRP